jgi:hypothetical protein
MLVCDVRQGMQLVRRRMLTQRVFSPAQSTRFIPDESTPNPPRRFLADFYRLSFVPPGILLGNTGEATAPNRVLYVLPTTV